MGITEKYAGLQGVVTQVSTEDAECLVHLDKPSHKKYTEIEEATFSEPLRDLGEDQWFASGLLEVVQESEESEKDMVNPRMTERAWRILELLRESPDGLGRSDVFISDVLDMIPSECEDALGELEIAGLAERHPDLNSRYRLIRG